MINLLKQDAKWSKFLKKDQYGKNQYAPAVDIKVRAVKEVNVIRNDKGEEITSSQTVYTVEEMNQNDKVEIDGKSFTVLTFKGNVKGNGEELFRTVYANG